jgi:hypothetical protein
VIDPQLFTLADDPISRHQAKASQVVSIFHRTARRFPESRKRIRLCQQMRRNLMSVYAADDWALRFGEDAAEWIEPSLPERQTLTRNLTNALADVDPQIQRKRTRETDPADNEAEQLERFLDAAMRVLYEHPAVIGKGVEDSEFLTIVQPEPSALLGCPQYMTGEPGKRKVRDRYGPGLTGRSKHRKDMQQWFGENPPITVRLVSALDCAPILIHGKRKRRFDTAGVIIRTLYDPEYLIHDRGYRFQKLTGDRLLVPRAFDSYGMGDPYGKEGQVYLYEAFLTERDEATGELRPFIVYCIGGQGTSDSRGGDPYDPESTVIVDLHAEYGIDYPLWWYDWALHSEDDDPDHRGIPWLYPLVSSILNAENLLLSHNAQAHENAFSGHVTQLPPGENAESWMEGKAFRTIQRPKTGEIAIVPGPVSPFVGAQAGKDAEYLEQFYMSSLKANTPGEAQFGGSPGGSPGGRQLIVERGLFQTAHRQIPDCGLRVAKFIAETTLRLACGLARGQWKGMKSGVNIAFAVNSEPVPGGRETTEWVEFSERWVGDVYDVQAVYPNRGNIAEVGQISELYDKGQASWDRLMEVQGVNNPMAERVKIALDQYWKSPEGHKELLDYAMQSSGRLEQLKRQELANQQQLSQAGPGGMPTSAMAVPTAPAQPGQQGVMTSAPGSVAGSILGSELSAGSGLSTLPGDAQAVSQIGAPGASSVGGGALTMASPERM